MSLVASLETFLEPPKIMLFFVTKELVILAKLDLLLEKTTDVVT